MADALLSMEEDLTCVICCDVYTDPVTLKCSHSLCEKCLKEFWRTQDVTRCPVCRKECSHDEPTKSLAFKSLCETFKRKKPTPVSEDICQEHNKKLKFFCYEDEKLFCVVCQALKIHENHKWSPVEEAVVNIKEDLEEHIDGLQATFDELKEAHDSCMKQIEFIEEHSSAGENKIKEEYKKLYQFLKDEEERCIRSLQKEVKSQELKIRARMEELSKQISDLSEKVAAVWQDMEAENITFLQNYSKNLQRVQCSSDPNTYPELHEYQLHPPQTMIFTTWARMLELVEKPPVTLDPKTASPKLMLSPDWSSFQYVESKLCVPENPERLYVGVLASQSFSSGLHCWDVEVGDNNHWTLGVVGATVNRKKLFKMDPKSHFWCFRYVNGTYRKCNEPAVDIDEDERPYIIRLQLDFDQGELSFIDPFRNKRLCTFTGGFPEKVFPYFCTGKGGRPLNIYMGKNTC
ncbi:nuclear factor 7, brain-like isoform X1 [Triplophysa dalaica]|uniref:nuclear factor 7, brain-like isoform X1 n=1 Tax=Triplophysa dalaica TaxID=1582913 RepID=UPI0024DF9B46|nr:nuclear factor 7, brain-like isoform X1 [Triplophysa dalaica]